METITFDKSNKNRSDSLFFRKRSLELFFLERGVSEKEVLELHEGFITLLRNSKEKHEDAYEKIEMLRKVELKFNFLVEWR